MSVPVVESVTTSQFNTNSTTLVVNMPATVNAGEMLVMLLATDGDSDLTQPAGWQRLRSSTSGTAVRGTAFGKVAIGDEDGTTVTLTAAAAQDGAAHVYRISNYVGFPTAEGFFTTGASTGFNPPVATPNWGTHDVLFIIFGALDTDTGVSTWSTGYDDNRTVTASGAGDANGATIVSATRSVVDHSGTEDPANTTLTDSVAIGGMTLALRGPLAVDDLGFARFVNVADSRVTTPDHNDLDITGDLDIRFLVLVDEVGGTTAPGVTRHQHIVTKGNPGSATGSFVTRQQAGGTNMGISWRESGGSVRTASSSAGSVTRGHYWWGRIVLDVDNGSGQYDVHFYTSLEDAGLDEDSVTWGLVNTITGSTGTSSINSSTEPVLLGHRSDLNNERLAGDIMYAEIRNGINGTKVAAVDFRTDAQRVTDTSLNDGFRVWTVESPAEWFLPLSAEVPFRGLILDSPPYVVP